jgi:uncharacterized membrane protein
MIHKVFAYSASIALLMAVGGIIMGVHEVLTIQGNDAATAGVLIGVLGTVATGILGFMSGLVVGKHQRVEEPESE